MLAEILKSGPLELLQSRIPDFIAIAEAVDAQKTLISNTIVRKLKTKLISRVGLRLLPTRFGARRAKGMGDLIRSRSAVSKELQRPLLDW